MAKLIGDRGTVYSRMLTNGGYLTSPHHVYGASMHNASPETPFDEQVPPDANAGAFKAPNYREEDDPTENCQNCEYLDVNQDCSLYKFKPKLYWVCDSFEAHDTGDDESLEDPASNALPVGKLGGNYVGS